LEAHSTRKKPSARGKSKDSDPRDIRSQMISGSLCQRGRAGLSQIAFPSSPLPNAGDQETWLSGKEGLISDGEVLVLECGFQEGSRRFQREGWILLDSTGGEAALSKISFLPSPRLKAEAPKPGWQKRGPDFGEWSFGLRMRVSQGMEGLSESGADDPGQHWGGGDGFGLGFPSDFQVISGFFVGRPSLEGTWAYGAGPG